MKDKRGIPAGMTTTLVPVKACFNPSSAGRYPDIFCAYINGFVGVYQARDSYCNGGDVGKIGGHAGCVDDIVERKLVEIRASFQQ